MKKLSIGIMALISLIAVSSCEFHNIITGYGDIITETLEIENFNGIDMLGAEDVVISYGDQQEVVVIGHENIISRIMTDVNDGIWQIRLEPDRYWDYELKYYITLPQINSIENEGAARVYVNDFVNNGDLSIAVEGAGDITLNRMENTENMYISIDGVGHIECMDEFPSLQYLDIFISGSGDFRGFPALTQECVIEIEGAATCDVSVEDQLDIFIEGAGVVNYKGNPKVYQWISGLGVVQNRN